MTATTEQANRRRAAAGRRIGWAAAAALLALVPALAVAAPANADDTAGWHAAHTVLQLHDGIALADAAYVLTIDGEDSGRVPGEAGSSDLLAWSTYTQDGTATMTSRMDARIVDHGQTTPFWVEVHTKQWGEANFGHPNYFFTVDCAIYRGDPRTGGTILDQSTASPYTCPSVDSGVAVTGTPDAQGFEVLTQTVDLRSLAWSTARGVLLPVDGIGLVAGPSSEGAPIESVTEDLLVDGERALQVPRVDTGGGLTFAAFQRNGETTDPNQVKVDFAYRLTYQGNPTDFWVAGYVQNVRHVEFNHDQSCTIYAGDPLGAGTPAPLTPYSCSMQGEDLSGPGDYQVTFTISRATVVDLPPLDARAMFEAHCLGTDSASCAYEIGAKESYTAPPVVPDGDGVDNPTPYAASEQYQYRTSRQLTNSLDLTVKAGISFFKLFSASVSATYGFSATSETDRSWTYSFYIPPGCHANLTLAQAFIRVHGDYLMYSDGTWYRAQDVTWSLPDPDAAYGGDVKPVLTQISGSPYTCPATGETGAENPGSTPTPSAPPTGPGTPPAGSGDDGASAAPAHTAARPSSLPATGADLDPRPVLGAAAGLILLGLVLSRVRRRRA